MASFAMLFSSLVHMCTCTHVHKALSNNLLLLLIAELEIWSVCMETGRGFFIHCWLGVWTDACLMILQPYIYIYWGSLWGKTCCYVCNDTTRL